MIFLDMAIEVIYIHFMRDQDWLIIQKLHKEKNITRTADLVFMTQPTLTKRIQQIEEELGILLVNRSSKGVIFTPEGEYVAEKAEEILQLYSEVNRHLAKIGGGKAGILKLGVPNSYCRLVMPRLIKEYNTIHKDIRFDISAAGSDEVLKLVENRDVDAGFVRGEFVTSLEQIVVSVDQIHVVSRNPLSLSELPNLPQIDFIKESTLIKATEKWWQDFYDTPPSIFMRVNHADTCLAMVIEGLGYGIFPDIGYIEGKDNLFTVPLFHKNGSKFVRKSRFVYHPEGMDNPIIKNFIDFIKKHGIKPNL
jgi:DNA-binding transcriptional LysR family regulator